MRIKNTTAAVLLFFMLFSSCAYGASLPYGEKETNPGLNIVITPDFAVKNGYAEIEAEYVDFDASAAKVAADAEASGESGIITTAPMQSDVYKIPNPTITVSVGIENKGAHYIWARVKAPSSSSDSLFVCLNGINDTLVSLKTNTQYYWHQIGSVIVNDDVYTFTVKYREPGVTVDKFVITTNSTYEPKLIDDLPPADDGGELWAEPPIKPISGHPRLYLTKDYIPVIKENVRSEELKKPWEKLLNYSSEKLDITLANTNNNYSTVLEDKISARALMYVMGDADSSYARETVEYAKDYLSKVTHDTLGKDITRAIGRTMVMASVVYDWCYDVMTDEDKSEIINHIKSLAIIKEIGYPPVKQSSVHGHAGEAEIMRDLLSAGIAVYDEDPEIYNFAAGRFFEEYIESRKLYNQGGLHPEGGTYGQYRYQWEIYAVRIFERMGYDDVFGASSDKFAYQWLYKRRPDGLMLKDGDEPAYSRNTYFKYMAESPMAFLLASGYYNNPYTKGEWLREYALSGYSGNELWAVLFSDPAVEGKLPDDLPLAVTSGYPSSSVTARTSWQNGVDAPTVVASMKAYEAGSGGHAHFDAGSFQIYYKGYLAIDGGNYHGKTGGWGSDHYFNYEIRSAAHNVVTVYDPDEVFTLAGKTYANDGGQKMRESVITYEELMETNANYAKCGGIYTGPDEMTPEFSYLQSDITNAYSDKVTDYKRSMVFMNLFDEDYPAAMVVFDKIDSSDASFKKTWNLHTIEQPEINGNTVTVSRTESGYNGKLVNRTLIPATNNLEIKTVGGEGMDAYVDGVNYANPDNDGYSSEQGAWRVEVSPKSASKADLFLNSMYVTDYSKNLPELEMTKIETDGRVGVKVKDRVVLFAKSGEDASSAFTLTLDNDGFDTVGCFVADVKAGMWNVRGEGVDLNIRVDESENAFSFRAGKGIYTVSPVEGVTETVAETVSGKKNGSGDFYVYQNGIFLNNKHENKLIDGRAYVPLKSFFEALGAKVWWEDSSATAYLTYNGNTLSLKENTAQYCFNSETAYLKSPVVSINGIFYVPAEDFQKCFNLEFKYDAPSKILFINKILFDKSYYETNAIPVVKSTASSNDGNIPSGACDLDFSSRWSASGDGQWLLYDLGKTMPIDGVHIAFYNGDKRKTIFDIEISTDGKNFTKVLSTESSGTTTAFEKFAVSGNARYVRFVGHGTNLPGVGWNSVVEMQVMKGAE